MLNKVLVFGEIRDGEFRNVAFESLAAAKQIAPDGEIVGVVAGEEVQAEGKKLFHYGADRVTAVEHTNLAHFTPEGYTQALKAAIDAEAPDAVIMGHTALGRDLSAKLAGRLNAGLVSDAVAIEMKDGPVFTRPIYSGKAFEQVTVKDGLLMATIRPNNIPALEADMGREGEVASLDAEIENLQTVIKNVVKNTATGIDLSEASVIVAGGRGLKGEEHFKMLDELADVLGGAVGASRGACDAEYCDYALQIGQTGKVVTPDLYIAVGLSGAIQHVAGMSNSKVIVAINKDPEAEIFQIADYGIVGDLFDIVPKLKEEFKKVVV
ncbi:electron transfer flavoprotein subunit alpha/FixB family protein [Salisediminibacterium halotolerans]|uniref:electron transfer flavoprotein subunit alpha/FixB family protein n=1 Tax=Salisediminibacterium halotolerans TaxID=517425 RepID=UPI000EB18EFB|nr:electron transfer flavoprotein subunit alpha/FixB family protein [Salisediminibacterium halotolerans]RLJ81126.1 electron transfer flavoprotein alpha subunit apoprotein [Actinophytocola xinjiangensis]RPE84065.1 electron transfer flavoprotein alpha subunit apoprotein [Salisediminibacterium halotolerans]TWG38553.1 electron transfer flavoprotein alpha subunit apoprotein [Salisediminibacterium halotolerans]GEL07171.1 electron transfer flavoprotein subunit alpha [Salisediminibacterium halotolerans